MEWALLLAGLAAGALFAWIVAKSRVAAASEQAARLTAELGQKASDLDAERRRANDAEKAKAALEGEKSALEEARRALGEKFESLASAALRNNNQVFLDLAKQKLEAQQNEGEAALTAKETAIKTLLEPVSETLKKLETETRELEKQRGEAYAKVHQEIENLQKTHGDLRRETAQLIQALRAPKTRGSWGELQLRKCIEFAGMVEHCTFDKEVYVAGTSDGEDSQRPDVVVQLPNQRCIIIDAKTPLEAFMEAMSTEDETVRADKLKLHAMQVRKHLEQLQKKRYWERLEHAADFVVCFLPSEVLFSAALEADPNLIEFGVKDNVVLATPTTLISLLRAVAIGWQQSKLTENARLIQETGLALYKKLGRAHDHIESVGKGIRNAAKAYDDLVGIVEGRGGVFSHARKLRELGVGDNEIETVDLLSLEPRELRADDWSPENGQLALAAAAEKGPKRDPG